MPRLLGEILVRAKAINSRQLEEAISNQVVFGGRLGTNLMDMGYITESALANYLSVQSGVPTIEAQAYVKIPKSISKALPKHIAERTHSVPLVVKEKVLHVLMADPNDLAAQDEIRFATGCKLKIYVAPEVRIYYLLHLLYGTKRDIRYVTLSRTDSMALRSSQSAQGNLAPAKARVLSTGGVEDASQSGDLMSEEEFALMTSGIGMGGTQPTQENTIVLEEDDNILLGDVAEDETEILLLDDEATSDPARQDQPQANTVAAPVALQPGPAADRGAGNPEPGTPTVESEHVPLRRLTLAQATKALQHVEDRDQIARVVLGFSSGTFKRSALFMVRPDMVMGWDGTGEKVTRETIERLMIPLNAPSVFKFVCDMRAHFLGALPKTPVNGRFVKALGGEQPRSAFIIPILFKGKVVNILYGDNGPGTDASFDIGELLILAMKIPQSFEDLVVRRKKSTAQE